MPTPSEVTKTLFAFSLSALTLPTPSDLMLILSEVPPIVILPTPSESIFIYPALRFSAVKLPTPEEFIESSGVSKVHSITKFPTPSLSI